MNNFFTFQDEQITKEKFIENINKYCSKQQHELIINYINKINLFYKNVLNFYFEEEALFILLPDEYIEELDDLSKLSKNMKLEITGFYICIARIYLNKYANYISVTGYSTKKIIYDVCSKKYIISNQLNDNAITLNVYDLYQIYYKSKHKNFPMTLKALDYLKNDNSKLLKPVITILFDIAISESLIWKDILETSNGWEDYFYPPIQFGLIKDKYNKKELLESKFKIKLPKSINKDTITIAYYKIRAAKLLTKEERQKIFNLDINENDFFNYYYNEDERINRIFYFFYTKRFNVKLNSFDTYYIEDYLSLSRKLKTKISLNFKCINGIKKQHDKLSESIKYHDMPDVKIKKNSIFKKLNLPEKYELIKTKDRLYEETILNNNCVWSYADDINNDYCMIYSLFEDGNRYTIEIDYDKKTDIFFIGQMFGYSNSICPEKYVKELNELLNDINNEKE